MRLSLPLLSAQFAAVLVLFAAGAHAQERVRVAPIEPARGGTELLQDGSFEATNPVTFINPFWDSFSTNFEMAWCNAGTQCAEDGGQVTVTGSWWAYFLGTPLAEVTTISQQVTIPAGANATLGFWQRLSLCNPTASHYLSIRLGGNEVYRIDGTSERCGESDYHYVEVDVSAFAGGTHTLLFYTEKPAGPRTSIYIDDVSLVATTPPPPGTDVILDGGFEATNPATFQNPFWASTSARFGTVWCDQTCYNPPRNEARTGTWWAYFFGTELSETSTGSQQVTLAPGTQATLTFWFRAAECNGDANSVLRLFMNDTELWQVDGTSPLCDAAEYTPVTLDVSAFAGGTHTLRFHAVKPATTESLSFFVDDVVLNVVVSAEGGAPEASTHRLSAAAPNPFGRETSLTLAVSRTQHVAAVVYDAYGRAVATLFEGVMAAEQARTLTLARADLAAGTYVVRVTGEDFSDARRVTLVR